MTLPVQLHVSTSSQYIDHMWTKLGPRLGSSNINFNSVVFSSTEVGKLTILENSGKFGKFCRISVTVTKLSELQVLSCWYHHASHSKMKYYNKYSNTFLTVGVVSTLRMTAFFLRHLSPHPSFDNHTPNYWVYLVYLWPVLPSEWPYQKLINHSIRGRRLNCSLYSLILFQVVKGVSFR